MRFCSAKYMFCLKKKTVTLLLKVSDISGFIACVNKQENIEYWLIC